MEATSDDLESLLKAPLTWTQTPHPAEEASNGCDNESISSNPFIQKEDPGLLLEKWLADQKCREVGQSHVFSGFDASPFSTPNSVIPRVKYSEEARMTQVCPSPVSLSSQNLPIPKGRDGHAIKASAPTSPGWKLHFFKTAVGIQKKREEYETKRRRSLLAFMKQAVHRDTKRLPTDDWEVIEGEREQLGKKSCAPSLSSDSRISTDRLYAWQWKDHDLQRLDSDRRRGSTLKRPSLSSGGGIMRQRNDSTLRRLLLAQRKQLLASHRFRRLPSQLQVESLIGEGASGRVWRVRHRGTGQLYALKAICKDGFSPYSSSCARVYAERHVLAHSGGSHHLVKLHAAFQDEKHLFLLQELLPGPSLFSLLTSRGPLPEREAKRYAAQLACAVHAVHKLGFVHRDIKPENAILDKYGDLKLIDLGLASRWTRCEPPLSTRPLSPTSSSAASTMEQPVSCADTERGHTFETAWNRCTESGGITDRGKQTAKASVPDFGNLLGPESALGNIPDAPKSQPAAFDGLSESFASWRLRQLSKGDAQSCVGTLHYMAPEVAIQHHGGLNQCLSHTTESKVGDPGGQIKPLPPDRRKYSKKADWWSFGAVLFECLFGHPPFAHFHLSSNAASNAQGIDRPPLNLLPLNRSSEEPSTERRSHSNLDGMASTHTTRSASPLGAEEEESSPLSCGLLNNPELLKCVLRDWKKHLRIPPPPFIVHEGPCAESTSEALLGDGQAKKVVSKEAVDLLSNLLCEEECRFGFSRVRNHPWFSSLDWEATVQKQKVTSTRRNRGPQKLNEDGADCVVASKSCSGVLLSSNTERCTKTAVPYMKPAPLNGCCPSRRRASTQGSDESNPIHEMGESKGDLPPSSGCNCRIDTNYVPDDPRLPSGCGCYIHYDENKGSSISIPRDQTVMTTVTSSSSGYSVNSPASIDSEAKITASDGESHQSPVDGPINSGSEAEAVQWRKTDGDGKGPAACPQSLVKSYVDYRNRWLMDLRFLGFEFDRRRLQARKDAGNLRAAYYGGMANHRDISAEARGEGKE